MSSTGDGTRRVWPTSPSEFVDTSVCPACFSPLRTAQCGVCGLDLASPRATDLLRAGEAVLEAERRRQSIIAELRGEQARRESAAEVAGVAEAAAAAAAGESAAVETEPVVDAAADARARVAPFSEASSPAPTAAPASASTPASAPVAAVRPPETASPAAVPAPATPPSVLRPAATASSASAVRPPSAPVVAHEPPRARRRLSVQVVLLIVGVSLVGVAAIFFLTVAFFVAGLTARALIIAGITVAAGAAAEILRRRSLTATGEGLAVLAVLLLALDVWAVRANGLFGADDAPALVYGGSAVIGVSILLRLWSTRSRLRVPDVVSAAGWPAGAALLVAGAVGGDGGYAVVVGLLAGAAAGLVHRLPAPFSSAKTREGAPIERSITLWASAVALVSAVVVVPFSVSSDAWLPMWAGAIAVALGLAHLRASVSGREPVGSAGGARETIAAATTASAILLAPVWLDRLEMNVPAGVALALVGVGILIVLDRRRSRLDAAVPASTDSASGTARPATASDAPAESAAPPSAVDSQVLATRSRSLLAAIIVSAVSTGFALLLAALAVVWVDISSTFALRPWSLARRSVFDDVVGARDIEVAAGITLVASLLLLLLFSPTIHRRKGFSVVILGALALAAVGSTFVAGSYLAIVLLLLGAAAAALVLARLGEAVPDDRAGVVPPGARWTAVVRAPGSRHVLLGTYWLAVATLYSASLAHPLVWMPVAAASVASPYLIRSAGPLARGLRAARPVVAVALAVLGAALAPAAVRVATIDVTTASGARLDAAAAVQVVAALVLLLAVLRRRTYDLEWRALWLAGFIVAAVAFALPTAHSTSFGNTSFGNTIFGNTIDDALQPEPIGTVVRLSAALLALVVLVWGSRTASQMQPGPVQGPSAPAPSPSPSPSPSASRSASAVAPGAPVAPLPPFVVERRMAGVALAPAVAVLLSALSPLAGWDEAVAPSASLGALVVLAVLAFALGRSAQPASTVRWAIEAGCVPTGIWAVVATARADESLLWVALLLAAVGLLVAAVATDGLVTSTSRRRHLVWLSLVVATSALWLRLFDDGVSAVEPYTVPPAIALIAIALVIARYRSTSRTAAPFIAASGMGLGLLPSVVVVLVDGAGFGSVDGETPDRSTIRLVAVLVVSLGVVVAAAFAGTRIRRVFGPLMEAGALVGAFAALATVVGSAVVRSSAALPVEALLAPLVVVLVVCAARLAATPAPAADERRTSARMLLQHALVPAALIAAAVSEIATAAHEPNALRSVIVAGVFSALHVVATVVRARHLAVLTTPLVGALAVAASAAVAGVAVARSFLTSSAGVAVEWFSIPLGLALVVGAAVMLARDERGLRPARPAVRRVEASPAVMFAPRPSSRTGIGFLVQPDGSTVVAGAAVALVPTVIVALGDGRPTRLALLLVFAGLVAVLVGSLRLPDRFESPRRAVVALTASLPLVAAVVLIGRFGDAYPAIAAAVVMVAATLLVATSGGRSRSGQADRDATGGDASRGETPAGIPSGSRNQAPTADEAARSQWTARWLAAAGAAAIVAVAVLGDLATRPLRLAGATEALFDLPVGIGRWAVVVIVGSIVAIVSVRRLGRVGSSLAPIAAGAGLVAVAGATARAVEQHLNASREPGILDAPGFVFDLFIVVAVGVWLTAAATASQRLDAHEDSPSAVAGLHHRLRQVPAVLVLVALAAGATGEFALALSSAGSVAATVRILITASALGAVHVLAVRQSVRGVAPTSGASSPRSQAGAAGPDGAAGPAAAAVPAGAAGARTSSGFGWWIIGIAAALGVTSIAAGIVDPIEAASAPVAVALVVGGVLRMRASAALRSMPALGPGLALLLLPSLVFDVGDNSLWRIVGLGIVSILLILVGASRKVQAPLLFGSVVTLIHAGAQLWPWISAAYVAVYWWVWLGIGGVLLIVIAARWERRVRDVKAAVLAVASLR